MAAIEMRAGAEFDPAAFAAFLVDQHDLGTKWTPRFVRITSDMPLTANNKVNKQPLRAARWETEDAVWVRREKDGPYERLATGDVDALRAEFDAHGRSSVLDA